MPQTEFIQWIAYLNNKGPDITEQQLAVLTTVAANAMGGKHKVTDFLVSKRTEHQSSSSPKPLDMAGVRGAFNGIATKK